MPIISISGERDSVSLAGNSGSMVGRWWILSLRQSLSVVVVVILVVFGAAEVVERLWLTGLDAASLHRFHLFRGISASFVVAVTVALTRLRTPPAGLAGAATAEEALKPPGLADAERICLYARWFIAMRWIAVALAGTVLFLAVEVMKWIPASSRMPLVWLVTGLAGSNLLYSFLVWRGRGVRAVLQAQGYVDLAIVTLLVHYSGGIENPLAMVMILHVIIGGILLSRRQCYGLAAWGSLMFGFMGWAEWSGVWKHRSLLLWTDAGLAAEEMHVAWQTVPVLGQTLLLAGMMFLTAYFVSTMAERLRRHEDHLYSLAEEARAEQQLLERALDTTGTALRVRDHALKTTWSNDLWNRWFGAPETPASPAARELQGPECPARQSLADGRVRTIEISLERDLCCPAERSRGGPLPCIFQITTAPLTDAAGRINQVAELAEDITHRKEAQARMISAGRLAALGELAGQVVHEVNNPVAIISGKARLLLAAHRDEMSPFVAQELGKITEMADRVARLARGLLASGRASTATRLRIDLREPVRKSLTLVDAQARRAGIQVFDNLPAVMPMVLANAQEMEQVFLNLFLNAVDAMPRGGRLSIFARVTPGSAIDHGWVAVMVADTGIGISGDLRERIFEPFFTTKPEGRGTGLGLSVCQGLVRSHQGVVEVDSEPGKGSCFIVKLPIADSKGPSGEVPHA